MRVIDLLDKQRPCLYNEIMFLNAIQPYVTAIVIALIVIQYAFALFCLLKLAYFDVTKKQYILWNLLILFAVYVGGIVFLVYYFKHPEKRISKVPDTESVRSETDGESDGSDGQPDTEQSENQIQGGSAETDNNAQNNTDSPEDEKE